jgi:hypothetical protein
MTLEMLRSIMFFAFLSFNTQQKNGLVKALLRVIHLFLNLD